MKTITAILIGSTICASAQLGPPPHSRMIVVSPIKSIPKKSPLSNLKVQENLLGMFKSQIEERRLKGFEAVRNKFSNGELKADDRPQYRVLLTKALDYQLGELDNAVEDFVTGASIFTTFNKLYYKWYISALNSREMSQTDWRRVQQSGKTFESMEREVAEATEWFTKLVESYKVIKDSTDYRVLTELGDAVTQIRKEVAWCDGEEDFEAVNLNLMITAFHDGFKLREALDRVDSLDKQLAEYNTLSQFNSVQQWAPKEVRELVNILNTNRLNIGLECMKLDEVLSKSCQAHCDDMVKLGYFSHADSAGKNFEDRARKVDWYGGPFNESIYAGSINPITVHESWWKSEDNRPKLYAESLNAVGVGKTGTTWTVVVGAYYALAPNRFIAE